MRRLVVLALILAGCATVADRPDYSALPRWTTHAIAQARGDVRVLPDGRRQAVRYEGWPTQDFGRFRTYAYEDARPDVPVSKATPPTGVSGDAKKGRVLFLSRAKAPCTGCHLVPGADVWPAGNVGPDLSAIGERRLPEAYLYQQIWDPRVTFPNTTMPPWGASGAFTAEEIVHLVTYLQTLKGPTPPEQDAERNPFTRRRPTGFGDNLDPTNNPAVVNAEDAEKLWNAPGPNGRACANCHDGGATRSMHGAAARYPKFVAAYGRVMSIEDFLTVHAPATTGREMLAEGADNLNMTMLIKMQSNGMPVNVDVTSPEAKLANERGRALYYKRVGQRNHACADCHDTDRGAGRYAGARVLGVARDGLTKHFPIWFMAYRGIWDIRKRFQVCMLPLGMNYLPADAPEYADLELYLTAFDNGRPMSVPGIR